MHNRQSIKNVPDGLKLFEEENLLQFNPPKTLKSQGVEELWAKFILLLKKIH